MQIQIPQYQVLANIGCGSQHLVYLAKQIQNSETYAIKIEKKPRIGQLENEIDILKRLNGVEGIPQIKETGVTREGKVFLILPLLYKNLLELRKQIKFSNWFIMSIGLRMIEILEQLHNKNILHLDIKPENIMICQEFNNEYDILKSGFIQLIDFGLSQQYQENSESLQDIFIGSFNFASRSSHYGQPLGFKDDLESLLYVLLYLKDLTLPWSNKQYQGFYNLDFEQIKKSKFNFFKTMILQQKSSNHLSQFISYIDQLNHHVLPDYQYIKQLFKQMIQESNHQFYYFKQDQQQSFCTPTQSYKEDSNIQKISNYENFDEILLDHKSYRSEKSEKTIILVSNLVVKYNTQQIKSIKDIKY